MLNYFICSFNDFLGCFLSAISNVFISLIGMLKGYIWKFWSNVYLSLFQHNMSVKQRLKLKSLGEKWQVLKDLESAISDKNIAKKCGVPKNTISRWTKTNA